MNRRAIIVLCSIIVVMLGIIAAGVIYLYHDVDRDSSLAGEYAEDVVVEQDTVKNVTVAQENPVQSDALAPGDSVQPDTSVGKEPEIDSEVKAADVSRGPFKVRNSGTGKENMIRQNKDNSLELLDEKGKSLWRKQLSSRIGGMVGQVDYFHNGKIQYLIVEGKNIHLIDRLGREVPSFPRKLSAKAIVGPEKVEVKGTNYWRVDTEAGTVYLNLKKNQILNQLPQ